MQLVRYQREGNPLYPLPPNYADLPPAEQRSARLNAVCLQQTPEDLVTAWAFFRKYYLSGKEARWYKKGKALESPPLHYQMVHDLATYDCTAWAAPRGFAKSVVMREIIMLLALTRPGFSICLIVSTDKKARKALNLIRRQFVRNKRIMEDFGTLQMKKGEGLWNTQIMELPNGSTIEGISINGSFRGERPDLILVDDPEYDEDEDSETDKLIVDFETTTFNTLMGSLEEGCAIFWIGTRHNRRTFLYAITEGHDPRFRMWKTRVIPCVLPNGETTWPAKWTKEWVAHLKLRMGSAFDAEMQGQPGSTGDRLLKIHPKLCMYRVEGGHPEREELPLASTAEVVYQAGIKDDQIRYLENRQPFGEWAKTLYRVMLIDHARTVKGTSDESCVMVMGFDRFDTLWVLDVYLRRCTKAELFRVVFDMMVRWDIRIIGSEAISVEEETTNQLAAYISEMTTGARFIPKVIPIKYAKPSVKGRASPRQMTKSDRIQGLEWRFNMFRIRLPEHRRSEYPVSQLFHQIENFTPDLSLLRHDDAVDTLAMHQHLGIYRRRGAGFRDTPNLQSPREALIAGQLTDEATGIPHVFSIPPEGWDPRLMHEIRKQRLEDQGWEPPSSEPPNPWGDIYTWN